MTGPNYPGPTLANAHVLSGTGPCRPLLPVSCSVVRLGMFMATWKTSPKSPCRPCTCSLAICLNQNHSTISQAVGQAQVHVASMALDVGCMMTNEAVVTCRLQTSTA